MINEITQPNSKGGSCLDYIITNSFYVAKSGVLHNLIADHYTVYCIRTKAREKHDKIIKNVCDYSKFDQRIFETLISRADWESYDLLLDPNTQWDILLENVPNITAVMCPVKKVYARKNVTSWLTPEIYTLIHEHSVLIKRYKISGNPNDLPEIKMTCNKINSLVDRSKRQCIKNSLKRTFKNPKKFWRIINGLIKQDKIFDISDCLFTNTTDNGPVNRDNIPDFVNVYFANIAKRVRPCNIRPINGNITNQDSQFEFMPPTLVELYGIVINIDVNISSCINGLNARISQNLLGIMPDRFLKIFGNSLFNWRPISQTTIFSKILEKLVHTRTLTYLQQHKLISEFQYIFFAR